MALYRNYLLKNLLFILFFCCPFQVAMGAGPGKIGTETPVIPFPDPVNLRANWWQYYNVEGQELNIRINETIEFLNALEGRISSEEYVLIQPIAESIIVGLQTLPASRAALQAPPPSFAPFAQSYTLEELIQLGRNLREEHLQLKLLSSKVALSKDSIRSGNRYINTLVASYLGEPASSKDKLLHGLEIMSEKISLWIDSHRLQVLEQNIDFKKLESRQTQAEIEYARKHLILSKNDLDQVAALIREAEKNALEARNRMFDAQVEQVRIESEHSFSSLDKAIASQKMVYAAIVDAFSRIDLINKRIIQEILLIQEENNEKDLHETYQKLRRWNSEIAKIEREIADWKEQTDLDLTRALKVASTLENQNEMLLEEQKRLSQETLSLAENTLVLLQKLENEIFINHFLTKQLTSIIKEEYTDLSDRIIDSWNHLLSFVHTHSRWLNEALFKIGSSPITPMALIKVVLILVLAYLFAKFTQRLIKKLGQKHPLIINESAVYSLSRLAYFAILILGSFLGVSSIGIDFTAFAFIAGALTFWAGFGMLPLLNNFVSGIIVLVSKNVRVGDFIELDSGENGIVVDINVRSTVINTLEGRKLFVPNIDMILKKFTNESLSEHFHRIHVPFKISYKTDRDFVVQIVIDAAKKVPLTKINKEPQVWLEKFCDKNIELALVVWVNDSLLDKYTMSTESIYRWAIDTTFREHNIPHPFAGN